MNYKFDFNDLLLVPSAFSYVNSRGQVEVYDENGMLPIFTAPMDTVVNWHNWEEFQKNKIYSIIPRISAVQQISHEKFCWRAYGLDDFEKVFLDKNLLAFKTPAYALLDVANGHMERVHTLAKAAKEKHGDRLVLMVGNIANPETYRYFAEAGVDYVRCGIGGGSGCLTTVQTGIGYPMASLIHEISIIKKEKEYTTKIVADGGFKEFSDITKALALGADYIMLGGMLNKAYESAGGFWEPVSALMSKFQEIKVKWDNKEAHIKNGVYKKYRGMSTKEVQRDWGKEKIKTSEGIVKYNKVEYTLAQWSENLRDYMKSAMSYCGSRNLHEFIGEQDFNLITQNSYNRFYK